MQPKFRYPAFHRLPKSLTKWCLFDDLHEKDLGWPTAHILHFSSVIIKKMISSSFSIFYPPLIVKKIIYIPHLIMMVHLFLWIKAREIYWLAWKKREHSNLKEQRGEKNLYYINTNTKSYIRFTLLQPGDASVSKNFNLKEELRNCFCQFLRNSHAFRLDLLKIKNLKHDAPDIWLSVDSICKPMKRLLNSGGGRVS